MNGSTTEDFERLKKAQRKRRARAAAHLEVALRNHQPIGRSRGLRAPTGHGLVLPGALLNEHERAVVQDTTGESSVRPL